MTFACENLYLRKIFLQGGRLMSKIRKILSIIIVAIFFVVGLSACNEKAKDLTYEGIKLADGAVGAKYNASVSLAKGEGTPTIIYELKDGETLPSGLSLKNGAITGTPTTVCSSQSFVVIAKAPGFNDKEATFSITIGKGTISYSSFELPQAIVGVEYSETVAKATAIAGIVITYELKTGSTLPAGLEFNNGIISGIPTTETNGEVSFTVVAKAGDSFNEAEVEFQIVIIENKIAYVTSELVKGTVGINYSETVASATADEGAIITYKLKAGESLPAGLIFNNGLITGIPIEAANNKSFVVVASAEGYRDVEQTFNITIDLGTIVYEGETYSGTVGQALNINLKTATVIGNGTPEIAYNIKSGTLPAGLTFDNGLITGTPTTKTEEPATLILTISANGYQSVDAEIIIAIGADNEITYLGSSLSATVGIEYNRSVATANAGSSTPSITYEIKTGTLPQGLIFDNGTIKGTPEIAVVSSSIVITASVEGFESKDATFTIKVEEGSINYTGTTLASGISGTEYNESVSTASAEGTITPIFGYSLKQGSTLPTGLNLSSSGQISGTPTVEVNNHTFIIVVSAENFKSTEATFTITIEAVELNSFIFEVAVADLSRFNGGSMYYGGEHTGPSVIERTGPEGSFVTEGHSTPYFLQGTHNSPDQTITWMINSDVATTAVLKMSLGIEIPGTFNMNSDSSGGGHIIKFNNVELTYGDITLSRTSLDHPIHFNVWTIATVDLIAGVNEITFTTGMNEWLINFDERYTEVGGPAIEFILFETSANLSWAEGYPKVTNLETNFPFDEWVDPNTQS